MNVLPPSVRLLCSLTLAVCAWAPAASAEVAVPEESAYFIRVWRSDDGLPPLTTPTLIEAPEGYLWMESNDGPVRFDGERATVFSAGGLGWPTGTKIVQTMPDDVQGIWVTLSDRSVWRERGGHWRHWAEVQSDEEPPPHPTGGGR